MVANRKTFTQVRDIQNPIASNQIRFFLQSPITTTLQNGSYIEIEDGNDKEEYFFYWYTKPLIARAINCRSQLLDKSIVIKKKKKFKTFLIKKEIHV